MAFVAVLFYVAACIPTQNVSLFPELQYLISDKIASGH